ncbi:hypothetical protein QYF36_005722 [Acer negundo]|nr:hypothetical protein QYF36_005722 [Acer negundo]
MAKLSQLSLPYPRSKKNKINNVCGDNNNNSSERKHDVVKTKVVMKVDLHDDRDQNRAMKTVCVMSGVESIQLDMKDSKMTIVGDIDPTEIVLKLRKRFHAEMLSVEPAKKPEDKKKNKINNVSDGGGGDGGGDGGDGGGGSDAGGGSSGGDNDDRDHTEGSGGGKMGTKMESMVQPDFRDFRNNAGDENGYPVGQLHRRNYEKPNVCSIIPYEKNILIATVVMAEAAAAAMAMAMIATEIIMVGIKLKGAELENGVPKRSLRAGVKPLF